MSDSDSDVYRCEAWFSFCTVYVCIVLFPIDVIIKRIMNNPCLLFIHTHISMQNRYCN